MVTVNIVFGGIGGVGSGTTGAMRGPLLSWDFSVAAEFVYSSCYEGGDPPALDTGEHCKHQSALSRPQSQLL
jgi:hypothetical protein